MENKEIYRLEIPQVPYMHFEVGKFNMHYGECTAIQCEFLPTKQGQINNEWHVEASLFYIVTLKDRKDGAESRTYINGLNTNLIVTYK